MVENNEKWDKKQNNIIEVKKNEMRSKITYLFLLAYVVFLILLRNISVVVEENNIGEP